MNTEIRLAEPSDAPELYRVIREAFSARPAVDPPADALGDTLADIEASLTHSYGILVERDGEAVAGLLMDIDGATATLRRVSVVPSAAGSGVGFELVSTALKAAADLGARSVEIVARREFPRTVRWWGRAGFTRLREVPNGWVMGRPLPVVLPVPDSDAMRALGVRLAGLLRAGDVVVASGELGAGKTTLAQGIGEGLEVHGPIISPTFVISRVHRARGGGPDFVHVDAYRLSSPGELGDIDIQDSQATSVTLVEWGRGVAEWLATDRLEIEIHRSDDPDDEERTVYLLGIGERWHEPLESLRSQA